MEQTIIFMIAAAGLMTVEVILIISVIKLTNKIEQLNKNTEEYFGTFMDKIRSLVDLFVKVQSLRLTDGLKNMKGGEIKLETPSFSASVELHKKNDINKR